MYEGNGFWICGGEEEESNLSEEIIKKLKSKRSYQEYDESIVVDKKIKKSRKVLDKMFREILSQKSNRQNGFLQ